jgi:tRNA U34 5-methylaminomethyl-2-thiouridine-forming methyltransferase MnmC
LDFFKIKEINLPAINLVYYDCFGAKVQPDLWEKPLFEIVKSKMKDGGLLTTYSSKGSVRRILKELNFEVTKLEGPKGKREMINAVLKVPS